MIFAEPVLAKLVVGLGNPGLRYAATRHNAGFRVLEVLVRRRGITLAQRRFGGAFGSGSIAGLAVGLLEPATFMNASGEAVAACLAGHSELDASRDCLVVYDDLDLAPGRIRLRPRGGAGGHRGLGSVIERLGGADVARLRFGIGRPPEGSDPIEYVLGAFEAEEERLLADDFERAADALEGWIEHGIERAMDVYNRLPDRLPNHLPNRLPNEVETETENKMEDKMEDRAETEMDSKVETG